jgi:predicted nucleic-acid-binding Zn-ribbon protein
MKNSLRCPKCEHRKILRVDQLVTQLTGVSTVPMPVAVRSPAHLFRRNRFGTFGAFVCAACGYTEIYANDIADLVAHPENANGVGVLDGETSEGPHR